VPELQDRPARGRGAGDLQGSPPQAAPGLKNAPCSGTWRPGRELKYWKKALPGKVELRKIERFRGAMAPRSELFKIGIWESLNGPNCWYQHSG
jgi:hypothetical protein